jgi:hypothetical protein
MLQLPSTVEAYVRSINDHDPAAFDMLIAADAVVNDAGRELRGRAAIKAWSVREIFDAKVTLEVLSSIEQGGETVVTTKVDGNFDRTGLPDPVVIDHHLTVDGDKICALTCRLADDKPRT